MTTLLLAAWIVAGVYGALANRERVERVWGPYKLVSPFDAIQHLCTLVLGPIGIVLVMVTGGRWGFWKGAKS